MQRIPEPELMEGAEQAAAYAAADFEAPHARVIELFREAFSGAEISGDVLDLGCGPGDIAMRFARAFPNCRVVGIDGSHEMLNRGREALFRQPAELRDRVLLVHGLLPGAELHGQGFDTVISNSLLHHLHDPAILWNAVKKFARPGASVFIVDLMRPADETAARELTKQYCSGEPEILRHDFFNSLLAAFTPEEIRAQLDAAGLANFQVRAVSDRHVAIWGQIGKSNDQASKTSDKSQQTRFKGVLFDLDGTLLDTLKDLCDSVNVVMAVRGFPTHSIDAVKWLVGEGARTLVERALPPDHRSDTEIDAALADYRADYSKNWNVATKPYDGIPEMLAELQKRGIALGVLSNKPHTMTVKCIEGYLAEFPFKAVLGQRDEVAKKPDPAGALEAALAMGLESSQVLYVGDTGVDMETARAAGMFALGATWGFRPESELREHGANAIIHHPRDVLGFL
jgi:2-phosphoglycolate phosphatase